jgi:hypothetical protein
MDRVVPKGVPVIVSLAGSWSEMNGGKCTSLGHCRQGPVTWAPTIIGMATGKPIYRTAYTHPTSILPKHVDYKVCAQLPSVSAGDTFLMTSGDPLKLSVTDQRAYEKKMTDTHN